MMLQDKVAVIYGAGGAIGSAVARAFASEGATVFLTGREAAPVEAVAGEIVAGGGSAEAAEVDALDERADRRASRVRDRRGGRRRHLVQRGRDPRCDDPGGAAGRPGHRAVRSPIVTYATSYFLTARLAARHMIPSNAGVIMRVTALHSRTGIPLVGGYGPAMAAMEALTRGLSAELAPHGIRVVGLRPQAMPETDTIREAFEPRAAASGLTWEEWQELLASRNHARRLMTPEELADMAVVLASDRARGLTGTIVNLTMGSLDD